jgi:hypothetical protein
MSSSEVGRRRNEGPD